MSAHIVGEPIDDLKALDFYRTLLAMLVFRGGGKLVLTASEWMELGKYTIHMNIEKTPGELLVTAMAVPTGANGGVP